MITTSNVEYYNRLKLLRQHGMSISDRVRHGSDKVMFEDHIEIGYNYRLTDIQAAVGIRQLEKLDFVMAERRKIAEKYHNAFSDLNNVRLPIEQQGYVSNYQSYSIYLKESFPMSRNELMQKMLDKGISTRRGIMTSHRETAYKNYKGDTHLPVSENASDSSIIIPLYFPMLESDVQYVIDTFRSFALS